MVKQFYALNIVKWHKNESHQLHQHLANYNSSGMYVNITIFFIHAPWGGFILSENIRNTGNKILKYGPFQSEYYFLIYCYGLLL